MQLKMNTCCATNTIKKQPSARKKQANAAWKKTNAKIKLDSKCRYMCEGEEKN